MLLALLLAAATPQMSLQAQQFKLDNGLTVIVAPGHEVPGIVLDLWYEVGSRDERPGRTGFAHLFEHLMFMGARYVPYPEFDTRMEAYGGRNNAGTANDTTHYFESGPSNLLEMFLWMEADRMATLARVMTPEKLEAQRAIVLNERRQSYENRPYGMAELALFENLFPPGHPYHWPVIGSAEDIEAAQLSDVVAFFDKWYVPSNAILCIVGDVDPQQAEALVRKYFGWIPSPPRPDHPTAPPAHLDAEKHLMLEDKVELPKVTLAWLSPADGTPGDADLDVLAGILSHGKGSRLYTRLIDAEQIASEVTASQDGMDLQGSFVVEITAREGVAPDALVRSVDQELARIAQAGPTAEEVDSARLVLETDVARMLESLMGRAETLNDLRRRYGDATAIGKELARYAAVTPATIQKTAQQHLGAARVRIDVLPKSAAQGGHP